ARPAAQLRHRHVLRLRQRVRSFRRSARILGRRGVPLAAAGGDAGHRCRAAALRARPRPPSPHQFLSEAMTGMRLTRRILIIIGIAIAFVITVPAGLIYYAAYTESGLQFIVRHIPKKIGRTQMAFVGAQGTVARGFTLQRFELEHERVHLRFEGIRGHITLLPLLWQTIHADDVTMNSAFVQVRRWQNPPPKGPPRFLPPGLIVRVDQAHVNSGALIAINGRRFDVTNVSTSGVARWRTLRFFDASFVQDAMRVSGKATLRAADPMQID